MLEEGSLSSLLTTNIFCKKQTGVQTKMSSISGAMCIEEMKKIRTDPEDEAEKIAGEAYFQVC